MSTAQIVGYARRRRSTSNTVEANESFDPPRRRLQLDMILTIVDTGNQSLSLHMTHGTVYSYTATITNFQGNRETDVTLQR